MAYNFIGESPDPLPGVKGGDTLLLDGLKLESKRFIGANGPLPSKGPPLVARKESPKQLKVRYMSTKADGRLKPETLIMDELPDNVTVRYMMWQMHEHLRLSSHDYRGLGQIYIGHNLCTRKSTPVVTKCSAVVNEKQ